MRLAKPNINADKRSLISSFASWLLDIGDENTGEPDPQDPENTSWVDIPINYYIPDNENGLQNLINFIYDQTSMELSTIAQLTPESYSKTIEVRLYRKWTGKSLPDLNPTAFCCILIDREHNGIQANMNLKDIDYFNQILQIGSAYRISNFICEPTSSYQQALENKTSLRFGKFTKFDNIPATTFPRHYFEFTSYNRLESKIPKPDNNNKMQYPILTEGLVRDVEKLGNQWWRSMK
ncbi:DNA helicase [Tanacetum coccineum]